MLQITSYFAENLPLESINHKSNESLLYLVYETLSWHIRFKS